MKRITVPKAIVQILSFILIPELFITTFLAIGNVISAIFNGDVSFEDITYDLLILAATVPATVFAGRFFCGFFCVFGTAQDFLCFLARKVRIRRITVTGRADKELHSLKYIFLILYVTVIWSGIYDISFEGPWTIFGQYLSIRYWPGIKPLVSLGGAMLVCIAAGSLFIERFFCRYFCPLGAFYSVISRLQRIKIRKDRSKCGSCRLCSNSCILGIDLTDKEEISGGECIMCGRCVKVCPRGNLGLYPGNGLYSGVIITAITITLSCVALSFDFSSADGFESGDMTAGTGSVYEDGTFTGEGEGYRGTVRVVVTVENGRITDIRTEETRDDASYMRRVENKLYPAVIESQNTDVDAVSGATLSSEGVLEAICSALEIEAEPDSHETEAKRQFLEAGRFRDLKDGIYTGSADAFRGDIEVKVTVKDGEVREILILSYCDNEEYLFRAAPDVIGEIVKEQSLNVDAVSGATYSSNGIIQAVANALEIPEGQYEPREGRNLAESKDKKHGHIVRHYIKSMEEYEMLVEEYG